MADETPNSLNEVRIDAEIGDDPAELAALADAVVRGCSIVHARIHSLRKLIEAVQEHSGARLAPQYKERRRNWAPPELGTPESLTIIRISNADVLDGNFQSLDIRVALKLTVRFVNAVGFQGTKFAGYSGFMRSKFDGDSVFRKAQFEGGVDFSNALFTGGAIFSSTKFKEIVVFTQAEFTGSAYFGFARFEGDTKFLGTMFFRVAEFDNIYSAADLVFTGAFFKHNASFQRAALNGDTRFDLAVFLRDAQLTSCANFNYTSFSGSVSFEQVSFCGNVRFFDTQFVNGVSFEKACFGGMVAFSNACFADIAHFNGSIFCDAAHFNRSQFKGAVVGDLRNCDVRSVAVGVDSTADINMSLLIHCCRWCARDFGWQVVRAIGQLQILNRVSVAALVGVPIVVAFWPAVQFVASAFGRDAGEQLKVSPTLALVYFAALFVTIGLMLYQVCANEVVRKHGVDEFIDTLHKRYPEGAEDRNDGLRRALDHLETIAKHRPDRHASFVKHHGETIWVPPREHIEWFKDPEEDRPVAVTGGGAEGASRSDEEKKATPAAQRTGFVPGAERARIVIEEGARAEYWLLSQERRAWAWLSFGCYMAGISCLVAILVLQAWHVVKAAIGWGS